MRNHSGSLKKNETEAYFVKDMPDGSCQIKCQSCGCYETTVRSTCINCHKYFVCRPWWSW